MVDDTCRPPPGRLLVVIPKVDARPQPTLVRRRPRAFLTHHEGLLFGTSVIPDCSVGKTRHEHVSTQRFQNTDGPGLHSNSRAHPHHHRSPSLASQAPTKNAPDLSAWGVFCTIFGFVKLKRGRFPRSQKQSGDGHTGALPTRARRTLNSPQNSESAPAQRSPDG